MAINLKLVVANLIGKDISLGRHFCQWHFQLVQNPLLFERITRCFLMSVSEQYGIIYLLVQQCVSCLITNSRTSNILYSSLFLLPSSMRFFSMSSIWNRWAVSLRFNSSSSLVKRSCSRFTASLYLTIDIPGLCARANCAFANDNNCDKLCVIYVCIHVIIRWYIDRVYPYSSSPMVCDFLTSASNLSSFSPITYIWLCADFSRNCDASRSDQIFSATNSITIDHCSGCQGRDNTNMRNPQRNFITKKNHNNFLFTFFALQIIIKKNIHKIFAIAQAECEHDFHTNLFLLLLNNILIDLNGFHRSS